MLADASAETLVPERIVLSGQEIEEDEATYEFRQNSARMAS